MTDRHSLEELVAAEREAGRSRTSPEAESMSPKVDLRTLLEAMVALRAEVRTETQASRRLHDAVENALRALEAERSRTAGHHDEVDELRRQLETQYAEALVDLFDRLQATSRALRDRGGGWLAGLFRHRRQRETASLTDALQLTRDRIEHHLERLGYNRIATNCAAFDPSKMRAVGVARLVGTPSGYVTSEVSAGFGGQTTVLREAEVIVNRQPETDEAQ